MTALNTPLTDSDPQAFRRGLTAGVLVSLVLAVAIALAWLVGSALATPSAPAAPAEPLVNPAPQTEINAENPYVRGPKIAY